MLKRSLNVIVALVAAGSAAGCARPRTPTPLPSMTMPAGEPHPASSCTTVEQCSVECGKDDANACTRQGDFVANETPQKARALWTQACDSHDGPGCARLMEQSQGNPTVADRYAWDACAGGVVSACEFLGTNLLVRAVAPIDGEDAAELFAGAAKAYGRACDLDSWFGCARAVHALTHAGKKPQPPASVPHITRAHRLAVSACEQKGADACLFIGQWADKNQDVNAAKEAYARGCRGVLASAFRSAGTVKGDGPICTRARELGAPVAAFLAEARAQSSTIESGSSVVKSKRIAGRAAILPPDSVRNSRISSLVATVKLCLSDQGRVTNLSFRSFSGSAAYDRRIFEAMRAWKYRPFTVDAKPEPVCTAVTFIYKRA